MALSFCKNLSIVRFPTFFIFHTSRLQFFKLSTFSTEEVDSSTGNSDGKHFSEDLEALKLENKRLIECHSEINDKYLRALAESENTRKRFMRQVEDAKHFGVQNIFKDLLDIADILTKAIDSAPSDQLQDKVNPAFVNLYEGLKMTEIVMFKLFEGHNLVQIRPQEGERFDPNYHEAVFKVPLEQGKEPNTVAVVTKVGYKLHERILRPAFIGVYG